MSKYNDFNKHLHFSNVSSHLNTTAKPAGQSFDSLDTFSKAAYVNNIGNTAGLRPGFSRYQDYGGLQGRDYNAAQHSRYTGKEPINSLKESFNLKFLSLVLLSLIGTFWYVSSQARHNEKSIFYDFYSVYKQRFGDISFSIISFPKTSWSSTKVLETEGNSINFFEAQAAHEKISEASGLGESALEREATLETLANRAAPDNSSKIESSSLALKNNTALGATGQGETATYPKIEKTETLSQKPAIIENSQQIPLQQKSQNVLSQPAAQPIRKTTPLAIGHEVMLFLPKINEEGIVSFQPYSKAFTIGSKQNAYELAIAELASFKGEKENMANFLSPKIELRQSKIESRTLILDFNRNFEYSRYAHKGIEIRLQQILWTIFTLAESRGEENLFRYVSFLIDGKRKSVLGGDGFFLNPFFSKEDLKATFAFQ